MGLNRLSSLQGREALEFGPQKIGKKICWFLDRKILTLQSDNINKANVISVNVATALGINIECLCHASSQFRARNRFLVVRGTGHYTSFKLKK